MTVRVLFFASLREAVGVSELNIEASSLSELQECLAAKFDANQMVSLRASGVRISVNQEFLHTSDCALAPGDEVGFMPPVTGG